MSGAIGTSGRSEAFPRCFDITVDIDAPPSVVWAVMSDVERWAEWTPSVTSIRRFDAGALHVGSRARVRQPRLAPADWQVTELDDGRSFVWVTRGPGLAVTARHAVEARAGGARAELSVAFAGLLGGVIGRLTRSLNRRYLGLEAEGLKRRSEARARAGTA